ncbi:hypothetical protein EGR_04976 [Echinococcus granulosus]|uniref:Uncharacterized protein n=1 Tax=Echinococcus granulosus TaxID=6210 RepID=W6UGN5_ECHGR|nr:hypothetical protein EGR_04976 [Echinococcus granulosus]EUB60123.1 hypothetical protein EGR_04976 [Echinococcus granulosus]
MTSYRQDLPALLFVKKTLFCAKVLSTSLKSVSTHYGRCEGQERPSGAGGRDPYGRNSRSCGRLLALLKPSGMGSYFLNKMFALLTSDGLSCYKYREVDCGQDLNDPFDTEDRKFINPFIRDEETGSP